MNKNKKLFIGILTLGIGILVYKEREKLKENNFIYYSKAIFRLTEEREEFTRISEKENKYLSFLTKGKTPLLNFMKKDGWNFEKQFGFAYVFTNKKGEEKVVIGKKFMKKFKIWTIKGE